MRLVWNGLQSVVASSSRKSHSVSMLAIAGMLLLASGCQSGMYDQNAQLHTQNRELQEKLSQTQGSPDTAKYNQEIQEHEGRIRELERALNERPPQQAAYTPASALSPAVSPGAAAPGAAPSFGQGIEVRQDLAAGTVTVNLPGDVLFDSGRATLNESSKSTLNKVVAVLRKEYAAKMIRVDGHTDSDPIMHSAWKSNLELSKARADAVAHYLESQGISASRVHTDGLGDSRPRSASDKRLNRRVEIVVLTRENAPSAGAPAAGTSIRTAAAQPHHNK